MKDSNMSDDKNEKDEGLFYDNPNSKSDMKDDIEKG